MKRLATLLLLLPLTAGLMAQGCAMCKAVAGQEEESSVNSGILWLMPIPYILLFLLFRKQLKGFWQELSGAKS